MEEVKRLYIGRGRLTQEKMMAFFHHEANFNDRTAGFFHAREHDS
jgi:hypothetical protein